MNSYDDQQNGEPTTGSSEPAPAPAASSPAAATAFPELSLLIRQGANIQGPYRMSRIKRYVAQRRIQPYMLFSQDGVFWLAPEHVPGLIPDGYVPVAPPARPTAVPSDPSAAEDSAPPAGEVAPPPPPPPGKEVGSITLVGFRLDEAEMAPKSMPASRPPPLPVAHPPVPPPPPPRSAPPPFVEPRPAAALSYYVRQEGQEAYGPYTEDVVRGWISEARIGPEAEYSTDARNWVIGARVPALFPPAAVGRVPGSRGVMDPMDEVPTEEPPAARSGWRKFRGRR